MRRLHLIAIAGSASLLAAGGVLLGSPNAFIGSLRAVAVGDLALERTAALALGPSRQGLSAEPRDPASVNPLSRVSIESLDEIIKRPLFSPLRAPEAKEAEPAPPPEIEQPAAPSIGPGDFTLLGVVMVGKARTALVRSSASDKVLRLTPGQTVSEWTLKAINARDIVLEKDGQEASLKLFAKAKRPALPEAASGTSPEE